MSLPDLPRFIFPNAKPEERHVLSIDDAKHAKVLRLVDGSEVHVVDGVGKLYHGTIHQQKRDYSIHINQLLMEAEQGVGSVLAVAPTKNMNRFEWVMEKAVELGVTQIIPIKCDNSERVHLKTERLMKIAQSALKQSKGLWLPRIHELTSFENLAETNTDHKWIAHCKDGDMESIEQLSMTSGSKLFAIGPEGDFSQQEIDFAVSNGFRPLSLGSRRLRTETAAITVCIAANLFGA